MTGSLSLYTHGMRYLDPAYFWRSESQTVQIAIFESEIATPIELSLSEVRLGPKGFLAAGDPEKSLQSLTELTNRGRVTLVGRNRINIVAGKTAGLTIGKGKSITPASTKIELLAKTLPNHSYELLIDLKRTVGIGQNESEIWHLHERPMVKVGGSITIMNLFRESGVDKRVIVIATLSPLEIPNARF